MSKAWIRALSGLSINLSAGWFGLAIITPNLSNIFDPGAIQVLIRDVFLGTLFLLTTVFLEKDINNK